MVDSPTPRARMARDIGAGSVSSGSPLAPPKTSPCVLDRLDLARPRAHVAAESTISAAQRAEHALCAPAKPRLERRRRLGSGLAPLLPRPRRHHRRLRDRLGLRVGLAVGSARPIEVR